MAFAAGMTVFPGGARDPRATPTCAATAVREVLEETGGARWTRRPWCPWAQLDDPGRRAAPLRHPVLRRRAARPGRSRCATGTEMDRGRSGCGPADALAAAARGELDDVAADPGHAARAGRRARTSARWCRRPRSDRLDPVLPRRVVRHVTAARGAPAGELVQRDGGWPGARLARRPGRRAGRGCVLAPNPGPMTLEGTNTWVLAAPGARGRASSSTRARDEGHLRRCVRPRSAGRAGRRSSCSPTGTPTTPRAPRRFAS